jgi:hypothetical protein
MTIPTIDTSTVEGWEAFLEDQGNFSEISYHGGGTRVGWFRQIYWQQSPELTPENRQKLYEHMVQAALNLWPALSTMGWGDWEENPICAVAAFAFDQNYKIYEECRQAYNRLWIESPRPHSRLHQAIAMSSCGELPVTPQDVQYLFELDGWRLIAFRLAGLKKFTNSMIWFGDILEADGTRVSIDEISAAVESGYPPEKGARWLELLYPNSERAHMYISEWRGEVM